VAAEVVPLAVEQAVTLLAEPECFQERFGLSLADGCVVFPESLDPIVEALESGVDPAWFAHLLVDRAAREVVGLGGFTGPPVDGIVEIGYAVAPDRRGRGHATSAVRAWLARAERADVRGVRARTAPEENASTAVLRRCGFARDGIVPDPDDGTLWAWRHALGHRAHRRPPP
jgi:[ribosomal protein S5]-alanine N-acetyltransferase